MDTEEELEREQNQSPVQTLRASLCEPRLNKINRRVNSLSSTADLRCTQCYTPQTTRFRRKTSLRCNAEGPGKRGQPGKRKEKPGSNLRWHSFALSAVAGFHGNWLKPGQQRSQDPPQVLCWQSHCSLRGRGARVSRATFW